MTTFPANCTFLSEKESAIKQTNCSTYSELHTLKYCIGHYCSLFHIK